MLQRLGLVFLRAALSLIAVLALAGCMVGQKGNVNFSDAPVNEEHGSNSPYGVVVIGIRTEDGTPSYGSLIGRRTQNLSLLWQQIDPETGDLGAIGRESFETHRGICRNHPACNDEDYTQIQYNLIKVTPAHYVLNAVKIQAQSYLLFLEGESSLLYDNNPLSLYRNKRVPGFEIKPGEIVYIGNYVFNATGEFAEFLRIESDPAEAQAALALYPDVRGDLTLRVPELTQ